MLHIKVSITIRAAQFELIDRYLDYNNWHRLFPLTIKGTKLLKKQNRILVIEVDHKKAGPLINILTILSDNEIQLEEFKPIYNATFINRFDAIEDGTKFTVNACISLKGVYRIAAPFVKGLIKNRIAKFVLEPMKAYSE